MLSRYSRLQDFYVFFEYPSIEI